MAVKRSNLLVFALIGLLISLYPVAAEAETVARRVNRDDKSFKGTWVHKIKTPGQDLFSVISRVDVEVKGRKYRISSKDGDSEVRFNGDVLWEMTQSKKKAGWLEAAEISEIPFWKMDYNADPLLLLNLSGEETVAGRPCYVFRIASEYKEGDVSVAYWVDKEKDILLKKEYILIVNKKLFVRESYESVAVEFDPVSFAGDFEAQIPAGWTKVKKNRLDIALLRTKY
ncbi:MAG: hypothetical protein HY889_05925 [Deltaproteobacteria bacterium]|nr:hypothetical protein [Deltaproteobacteria bacterium]